MVPLDSQFFLRACSIAGSKAMHSLLRHGPHRTDAARARFMPGSSALALNLRAFQSAARAVRSFAGDESAHVIGAHDQGRFCHRLFSDADVIFDCLG
jgi:hypothetical protein